MHWIDPNSLPEIEGEIERFTPNPKGELDGLLLRDGTFVHFPPHMTRDVVALVRTGDTIRIRGVRPRHVESMIDAVAIVASDGRSVVDRGPHDDDRGIRRHPHHGDERKAHREPMQVAGRVRRALHGPKGELRGALLDDGSVIRLGPEEAERFADLLRRPGVPIAARGEGVALAGFGRAIEAFEIGLDGGLLEPVRTHGPKPPKKRSGHRDGPRHKSPD